MTVIYQSKLFFKQIGLLMTVFRQRSMVRLMKLHLIELIGPPEIHSKDANGSTYNNVVVQ